MPRPPMLALAVPLDLLAALSAEPALVVLLLVTVVGTVAALVLVRLRRLVRAARTRAAIEDYLLGVEDALACHWVSARERLGRVVQLDPENHGARALLAEALTALDDATAAHEHYVMLRTSFGIRSPRVLVGYVRTLLAVDRAAEALRVVGEREWPQGDLAALRLRLQVELRAGSADAVVATASQLAARLAPGPEGDAVRETLARAQLQAGAARARRGEAAAAAQARRAAASALAALNHPRAAATRVRLLGAEAMPAATTPGNATAASTNTAVVVRADEVFALVSPGSPAGLLRELAYDAATAPYACRVCGTVAVRAATECAQCGAREMVALREPGLQADLPSAAAAADAIEENDAHLQRLLEQALEGNGEAQGEIQEVGVRAVPLLFARAVRDGAARPRLMAWLEASGAEAVEPLLSAYEQERETLVEGDPRRDLAADLVGRAMQAYGRAALPALQARLRSEDHDWRKIVVDFHLGLDEPEELAALLDSYPPVEVIQRLNAAHPERLQKWLANLPERGFLAEVLLVQPMFRRAEDLLRAAALAKSPAALLGVLTRRGPSHELASFAVGHLDDPAIGEVCALLLRSYGAAAADALLAGYLEVERKPVTRSRARDLLVELGSAVVPQVCLCIGASPARLDDGVVDLLIAFGPAAVDRLRDAYAKRNLLERVGGRLVRRYNHPRNLIVKVLARIGGPAARAALTALRATETDTNLKLRLDQALQLVGETPVLPSAKGEEPTA